MTSPARFDASVVFFLIIGIAFITVGMAFGLGKIGDAMVMNNPDAGNLYNPANVSTTIATAGLIMGLFVAMGSAMIAISVRRCK